MTRRHLLRTSAGYSATLLVPGLWSVATEPGKVLRYEPQKLPEQAEGVSLVRVTPGGGNYVHTYYDVCPWSPSGRYLATTRVLPLEGNPTLGQKAECCVIDLQAGTLRVVYSTVCWGFQTGAVLNWGATDGYLFTNDVVAGQAVTVRIDLETGETLAFAGPGYHISPDGNSAIGFPLELMHVTQGGYGMPPADAKKPPCLPVGAAKDQGMWLTDMKSNSKRLLVSLADAAALIPEKPPREAGTYYFWHAKFNRQGTRIQTILRCIFPDYFGERNPMVVTFKPDGSELRMCPFKPVWGAGGGHPNWHGDGEHIVRHVEVEHTHRFVMTRYDAAEMTVLSDKIEASGHPSIEPKGRYLITDDHPQFGKSQHVILRFIDLKEQTEAVLAKLPTVFRPALSTNDLRLDGHPVWNRDYTQCCLQATHEGERQLFVIDLKARV